MKIYKDESKNKIIGKNIKFNKNIKISTVIGIIVVNLLFVNNSTKEKGYNYDYPFQRNIENSYVKDKIKNNIIEEEPIQKNLIKFFCEKVYGLNFEIVYNLACDLTNNFTSNEYLETLNPGFSTDNKKTNNIEHGIITFVRHIYQKPKDFNLNKDDIIDTRFINDEKGNEESKVKYYCDIYGIDPVLTLAIQYQESYYGGKKYSSNAYIKYNNPAGLISPGEPNKLWKFPSPDAGIIEHIVQLKKNYIDYGLTTPEEIRDKYSPANAENDIYNLNRYWVSGVNHFMKEIEKSNILNDIDQNIYDNTNKI